MPDFDYNSSPESQNRPHSRLPTGRRGVNEDLADDKDLLMEQILENINTTPIGQVLKKIASLPEVRRKKIMDVRQQLTEGKYDLKNRLDIALDKVIENLTI